MPLIRTLVWAAARQAASNPAVRRAVVDAARKAAPVVGRAARDARVAARDVARDRPPLKDPAGFAWAVATRLRDIRR